nr:MAG TPA: hypothetical protein [Caudoviricetes sp.]
MEVERNYHGKERCQGRDYQFDYGCRQKPIPAL